MSRRVLRPTCARAALYTALLALAGCVQTVERVGSDCEEEGGCVKTETPLEAIDAVDILLVIDSSASIREEAEQLKAQLPRLINAIVTGQDEEAAFPPASSVHVAVATSDLGADVDGVPGCEGVGDDGVFIRPGEAELTCEVSYPGYLAYEGGPAAIASVDSVSCVPLVGIEGCGYEQPLEAALKALWPASDPSITFREGAGHGDGVNAGFLRESSLLVVAIVTDEDDCSSADDRIFASVSPPGSDDTLAMQDPNVRCFHNPDALHPIERFVDGLQALRADNDNVIFAVIGGVPPELTTPSHLAGYDLGAAEGRDAYYDDLLEDPRLEAVIEEDLPPEQGARLRASCESEHARAEPPRRLIEMTRHFGERGVVGSICADDFGLTTGQLIRTIGERLTEAAEAPAEADGEPEAE